MFLGRQPILDRSRKQVAYELLFRTGRQNAATFSDPLGATAAVITNAFAELGIEEALGPYKGFINCDADMLVSDSVELLPRSKVVLEVLETVEMTQPLVERCRALHDSGFALALDDVVACTDAHTALLELQPVVKVDLTGVPDAPALEELTAHLRPWNVKLLAEKVDSEEQFRRCLDLGYEYFQGYFFARPTIIQGKKLNTSELSLMRLLGLLLRDAETAELEDILKREPGLSVNLLRLTNSVASGVRHKVDSLRQAITVLGRRQLQRWLQLLLFTSPAGEPTPLLHLAATRGRLLELLAPQLSDNQETFPERAFLVGAMSLMPTLLGVPMERVVAPLNLSMDVKQALLHRTGLLGDLLRLLEAHETNDEASLETIIGYLEPLTPNAFNHALSMALAWAHQVGQPAH